MRTILRVEADRQDFIKKVMAVKLNKPFVAEIKQYRKTRSMSQNNLMWLWLGAIEKETGNDKNYMHEYFKNKYLPKIEVDVFGEINTFSPTTKKLASNTMTTYLDKIFLECSENGIELKKPDDYNFEQFIEYYKEHV